MLVEFGSWRWSFDFEHGLHGLILDSAGSDEATLDSVEPRSLIYNNRLRHSPNLAVQPVMQLSKEL